MEILNPIKAKYLFKDSENKESIHADNWYVVIPLL